MKNQVKHIFAIVLALVMVLTLFAGCKQSTGEEWESVVVYESTASDGSDANDTDSNTQSSTNNNEKDNTQSGTDNNGKDNTQSGTNNNGKDNTQSSTNNNGKDNTQSSTNNNGKDNTQSGGNNSSGNSNTTNPLKYDLGGKTINIYSNSDFTDVNSSSSKAAAAQAAMVKKLEKDLNCKIVVTKMSGDAIYKQTLLNVASGTYFADIISAPIHNTVGFISSQFTYDLSKISTVDLSKDYMNIADGVSAFKLGNGNYAIAEPLSNSSFGNHLFVNKRILKEITGNENYIYNLMSNKQWNITNFRDLAKKAVKDLDGVSGITTEDRLGIIQIDIGTSAYSSIFETLGVDMLKNNNGKIEYNMQDKSVVTAANLAYEIYVKDGTCKTLADAEAADAFRTGHGLFLGGSYMSQLSKIADMEDEFGLVPFPTQDGGSTYKMPVNWNFATMMIPSNLNSNQAKDAGAFLQAYCYLAQNVIDVKYDEYMNRYLCDDESRKNLDICYNAVRITPSSVIGNSSLQEIFNGTYKVCYSHASGENISTLIQSTANSAKAGINDLNSKFK